MESRWDWTPEFLKDFGHSAGFSRYRRDGLAVFQIWWLLKMGGVRGLEARESKLDLPTADLEIRATPLPTK